MRKLILLFLLTTALVATLSASVSANSPCPLCYEPYSVTPDTN